MYRLLFPCCEPGAGDSGDSIHVYGTILERLKGLISSKHTTDLAVAREELGATEQREDLVVPLLHHENLMIRLIRLHDGITQKINDVTSRSARTTEKCIPFDSAIPLHSGKPHESPSHSGRHDAHE